MNTLELERLTKLANRLPVHDVIMERIDSDHGEIYYAYGQGFDGVIHGIWGHQGIAQMVEFKDTARVEDVRQVLVNEAASFIDQMKEGGVYA